MPDISEILKLGIQLKRAGQTREALEAYSQARELDPEDYRSYGNAARLLVGIGKYDLALRYFLVVCVSNDLRNLLTHDSFAETGISMALPRFISNTFTIDNCTISPERVIERVELHPYLRDIIYRADNLTFYIGHAVIAQKSELITKYSIPVEAMRNLESAMLGHESGLDLRDSALEYVFLLAGFVFVDINYRKSFASVQEAAEYYLSSDNLLVYNFSDYNNDSPSKQVKKMLVSVDNFESLLNDGYFLEHELTEDKVIPAGKWIVHNIVARKRSPEFLFEWENTEHSISNIDFQTLLYTCALSLQYFYDSDQPRQTANRNVILFCIDLLKYLRSFDTDLTTSVSRKYWAKIGQLYHVLGDYENELSILEEGIKLRTKWQCWTPGAMTEIEEIFTKYSAVEYLLAQKSICLFSMHKYSECIDTLETLFESLEKRELNDIYSGLFPNGLRPLREEVLNR